MRCCSSSSPTRVSGRWCCHDRPDGGRHAPSSARPHAHLRRSAGHLRAGPGHRPLRRRRREYLDFITGLAVVSLGHAHPAVADAVAEQARTLSHVSNLYGNTLAPEVARTIDRLINGGSGQAGGQVFFANSGAEANECALKLARRWAGLGRHVVISADNAFHGRTLATLTATGQPEKQAPFVPLPRVRPCALRRRRRARQSARPRHCRGCAVGAAPG